MCGITGVYHFNNSKTVDETVLVRMRDSLVHRGPDSAGLYVSPDRKVGFGFRRLAIIDLSEAGNQPMPNEDKTIWIVFNGEIYNFQELRKNLIQKGHTFRSNTDTEVIIHQYEEDGPGCLEKFNGMFSFAIYDEKKEQIFFARDRLGIKPFYYGVQNGSFSFGSEIKAILADPNFKRRLNEEGLYHYTTFSCCPAPFTLFEDIKKLPAGWYGILHRDGRLELEQYWDAVPQRGKSEIRNPKSEINSKFQIPNSKFSGRIWTNAGAQEEYYIEEVRRLLEDSIRGQMVSDVPFGVFLSGGIDSSTNAIFMSEALGHPVETFSIGYQDFPELNEFQYSRKVAALLSAKKRELTIGEQELFEFLPKMAYHADDPNGDYICLPVFQLARLVRDSGVIMIQVGEGSDEIFAGYEQYLQVVRYFEQYVKKLRILPSFVLKVLYSLISRPFVPPKYDVYKEGMRRIANQEDLFWGMAIAFSEHQKKNLFTEDFLRKMKKQGVSSWNVVKDLYGKLDERSPRADVLARMIYLELKIRLPELLLMRVDKMASAHSIEARVPFLDHRIVELAMQIPMAQKIKNMESKYILKKAVAGKVPEEIILRKKQGFMAPMDAWLKGETGNKIFQRIWASELFLPGEYFSHNYIKDIIENHRSGRVNNSFRIWNLFTLAVWHDEWMR